MSTIRDGSLCHLMHAIAQVCLGTPMEPIMQAIHGTHESDVVSDVLQLLLAFLEIFVCRNIRNEMFPCDLLPFGIVIAVIYILAACVL